MARTMTPEERKAFGEKMKALREAKRNETNNQTQERVEDATVTTEVPEASKNTITLRFKKKIDVGINGVKYTGPVVELNDIKIASEIVRLAKEAYGWDILE